MSAITPSRTVSGYRRLCLVARVGVLCVASMAATAAAAPAAPGSNAPVSDATGQPVDPTGVDDGDDRESRESPAVGERRYHPALNDLQNAPDAVELRDPGVDADLRDPRDVDAISREVGGNGGAVVRQHDGLPWFGDLGISMTSDLASALVGFVTGVAVALAGGGLGSGVLSRFRSRDDRGVGDAATARAGTATSGRDGRHSESDEEHLVPDEQRVERLLARNDGRMKQSEVVRDTEWSKSKVSRLLSRMAEEGDVVKVSLGRENLICLDGREPEFVARSGPR